MCCLALDVETDTPRSSRRADASKRGHPLDVEASGAEPHPSSPSAVEVRVLTASAGRIPRFTVALPRGTTGRNHDPRAPVALAASADFFVDMSAEDKRPLEEVFHLEDQLAALNPAAGSSG